MALFKRRPKPVLLESLDQLDQLVASGQPVLVDFFRFGCSACQIMDGIVNELAEEYAGSAHVVKANVSHLPAAVERFKLRATPTFLVLTATQQSRRDGRVGMNLRWRSSGLVKKHTLAGVLESNGAVRAEG
jgi:thioredoxin 1